MVGIAPDSTGKGYWVATANGGVFSYGDAKFYGSAGNIALKAPIVGIVRHRGRRGLLPGGVRRRRLHLR